jgi:site-specific DNA-methyltransferase (adenine-specific)/site-specific DNA-methyltransferase (cytosine-N4-specific)
VARAAEVYARRQKLSEEAMAYATEIKVDALTLMGEFLQTAPKNKGAKGRGSNQHQLRSPNGTAAPTLKDLGISKRESADAQTLATLKVHHPEAHEQVRQGALSVQSAAYQARQHKRQAHVVPADARPTLAADLFQIDEADVLDWFAAQQADSADMVLGSGPYMNARSYGINAERDCEEWIAWMLKVSEAAARVCRGPIFWVLGGVTERRCYWPGVEGLMYEWWKRGHQLYRPNAWVKRDENGAGSSMPGTGFDEYLRSDWEYIVCLKRPGQLPWSDNTVMGHPPKFAPGGDMSNRDVHGRRANDGHVGSGSRGKKNGDLATGRGYRPPALANPGNVVYARVGGGHMGDALCHENEAPFPEALAEFFIRSFCPPGGIVCDPFSGSGTTAKVALQFGRRFRGCDLRASQVQLTRTRVAMWQASANAEKTS